MISHVMRNVAMVRVALLLCLLSTTAGAARIKANLVGNTLLKSILLEEVGLRPEQQPEWDGTLTSESSAMLNGTSIKCEGNKNWKTGIRWTAGPSLGEGTCGKIIQVTTDNTNKSKQYAIKMPHLDNQSSLQEIDQEAMIMWATTALFRSGRKHECRHVAPLFDPTPCLDDVLFLTGAYVTLKMEMDLSQWYKDSGAQWNEHIRKQCQEGIASQLADGLKCLHTAGEHGFMHGDFKMDNVLVESIEPETGCPRGLRLIDFGLSHALGSEVKKHKQLFFTGSVHLPDSVFQGAPDTLSLTLESNQDMFYASTHIDWCSYVYLMNSKFNYNPPREAWKIHKATSCGKMGHGRHLAGNDVQGGLDVQGVT